MAFIRSNGGVIGYSPKEEQLLKLLPLGGTPISSNVLLKKHYGRNVPMFGRQIINVTMNSLINKVKVNKEKFLVKKSKRRGPIPIEYWMEAK